MEGALIGVSGTFWSCHSDSSVRQDDEKERLRSHCPLSRREKPIKTNREGDAPGNVKEVLRCSKATKPGFLDSCVCICEAEVAWAWKRSGPGSRE